MLETLKYTTVDGERKDHDITSLRPLYLRILQEGPRLPQCEEVSAYRFVLHGPREPRDEKRG